MGWLLARLKGAKCWFLGHEIFWRVDRSDICAGDIICETCNLHIWCRWYDPWSGKPE